MGQRAHAIPNVFPGRDLGDELPDEAFVVEHVSGPSERRDGPGHRRRPREDLPGRHAGSTPTPAGGDDSIIVRAGVLADVEFHGGSGNDTLIYEGTRQRGAVRRRRRRLHRDRRPVGTTATVLLDGGAGDDFIVHNGADARD